MTTTSGLEKTLHHTCNRGLVLVLVVLTMLILMRIWCRTGLSKLRLQSAFSGLRPRSLLLPDVISGSTTRSAAGWILLLGLEVREARSSIGLLLLGFLCLSGHCRPKCEQLQLVEAVHCIIRYLNQKAKAKRVRNLLTFLASVLIREGALTARVCPCNKGCWGHCFHCYRGSSPRRSFEAKCHRHHVK